MSASIIPQLSQRRLIWGDDGPPFLFSKFFSYLCVMSTNKNKPNEQKPDKFERIYEDDESISIWKYNLKKNPYGPVEVEYKWKKGFNPWNIGTKKKTLGDLAKEERKKKKGS